jgi:hypothetical protein
MQLSAGVDLMLVLKWLGHSTFTPILDVYSDYIPARRDGEQRGAAVRLNTDR